MQKHSDSSQDARTRPVKPGHRAGTGCQRLGAQTTMTGGTQVWSLIIYQGERVKSVGFMVKNHLIAILAAELDQSGKKRRPRHFSSSAEEPSSPQHLLHTLTSLRSLAPPRIVRGQAIKGLLKDYRYCQRETGRRGKKLVGQAPPRAATLFGPR